MATKHNLYIDQGTSFTQSFSLQAPNGTPLDLTGYTGVAQFRREYASNTAINFTVVVGGNTGVVTIQLTPNNTSNIEYGRYVYDIELQSNGVITRIMEGVLTITPEVTR